MNLAGAIELVLSASAALVTYRAITFAIWFGHWLPHRSGSRLREYHMGGHHAVYADSAHARSALFRYAGARHSSLVPLAPWVLALASLQWLVYPPALALACTLEIAAVVAALTYTHECFHMESCWLTRFRWFRRARAIHDLHHDTDVNFMVADHFWDRVFGTFRDASDSVRP